MISKRIIGLVLCLLLSFSCVSFADDASVSSATGTDTVLSNSDITDSYEEAAIQLYMYGLFKGGSNGFDLSSDSTKAQAAVMIVRLLGAESAVLNSSFSHPYSDVPGWASNYVGYLYQHGVDIAKSETVYGASDNITLNEFLVMVLQSLGYEDVSVATPAENVSALVKKTGLLTEDELSQLSGIDFDRGTMVYVSKKALDVAVASTGETLYQTLDSKNKICQLEEPDETVKYGTVQEIITAVAATAKPDKGSTIVSNAKVNLGVRYRGGGKSPSTGFDCSGFVGYTMMQSGVWSSHPGSCDGVYSRCTKISMSEAKPGDIVFFKGTYSSSHTYTHVGIYLGNGQMIHSASSSGVSISSITSGYWANHYSCVARPTALM